MFRLRYFVVIYLCISCIVAESLTYFTIREKWQDALLIENKNISSDCSFALKAFKDALKEKKINWAVKMFDASTKIQAGLFVGNLRDYGSYEECLEISETISNETDVKTIQGKHCMTNSPLFALMSGSGQMQDVNKLLRNEDGNQLNEAADDTIIPVSSICVPHLCDTNDLNEIFKELLLHFEDVGCNMKTSVSFSLGDILASVFFGLFLGAAIISTTYDVYLHYAKRKPKHVLLLAFSVLSNGRKLLTLNDHPSQLQCLDGLRFISMMWVVLSHTAASVAMQPIFNTLDINYWLQDTSSMYIIGATVSVDTFFVLSGLVLAYVFFMAMQRGVRFNLIMFYVHRYLRLTPALLAMIIFQLTFTKYISSGPLWPQISKIVFIDPCQEAWWVTLLYLQNYVKTTSLCVPVAWYLAVDMQLFVLSPLILFPLKKWPKYTIPGILLLAFGSVMCGFILAWDGGWVSLLAGQKDPNGTLLEMQTQYYTKTHTRAAPWLIGIILGYCVFKHKSGKPLKIAKPIVLALWIGSLAVLAACVFGGATLLSDKGDMRLESASHVAFVRPAWAIALCWIIYACVFNYGGPVNAFLSWSFFRICTRFAYSLYIVHYIFLSASYLTNTLPMYFTNYTLIHSFIGDLVVVFFIAAMWTLLFESPIVILEKVLLGNKSKPQAKAQDHHETPQVRVAPS